MVSDQDQERTSSMDILHTIVIGANLKGLVASHQHTNLASFLVFEEFEFSSTALLPLRGFALGGHSVQLGSPMGIRKSGK